MERFAAIDIGTNSVLLVVAERDGWSFRPVLERLDVTRLGRGVDASGRLDPAALADTTQAVATFVREARSAGAEKIACVATSAARDAANGAEFIDAVRSACDLTPEIIGGEEEARLSYLSAWREMGPGQIAVLDI